MAYDDRIGEAVRRGVHRSVTYGHAINCVLLCSDWIHYKERKTGMWFGFS